MKLIPRLHRVLAVSAALALAVGLTACATAGTQDSDPTPEKEDPTEEETNGETDDPIDDPVETAQPATCEVKPVGAIKTDGGDVIYQNQTVTIEASHVRNNGCVNSVDLSFDVDGGCALNLTFTEDQGVWALSDGTFTGDDKCTFWEDEPTTFTLDTTAANTVATLIGLPKVDDNAADESCARGASDIQVVGKAFFVWEHPTDDKENKFFNVNLNGLSLNGGITTKAVEEGACPGAPAATCQGVVCGEDFFGASCGGCEEGYSCAGGACVVGGCLPAGDGDTVGFHIGDTEWTTSENEKINLHQFCEASAVWIIKSATW